MTNFESVYDPLCLTEIEKKSLQKFDKRFEFVEDFKNIFLLNTNLNKIRRSIQIDSFAYAAKNPIVGFKHYWFDDIIVGITYREVGTKNIIYDSILDKFPINKLFGLERLFSHIYEEGLVICEGYFDYVFLSTIFKNNLIATFSSSINNHTLEYLKSISKKFLIAFDNDDSGIKAYQNFANVTGELQYRWLYTENKKDCGDYLGCEKSTVSYLKSINSENIKLFGGMF